MSDTPLESGLGNLASFVVRDRAPAGAHGALADDYTLIEGVLTRRPMTAQLFFRGAHAARVLVTTARRHELCFGWQPKPTRQRRVLPNPQMSSTTLTAKTDAISVTFS